MRATLIGRFLLLAIVWLAVLLPLWYWAAKWFAAPPIWLAGTVMKSLFSWVDGFAQEGVNAVLHTLVQVRMQGPQGDALGELAPEVSYPTYGYGLVLLWAMLLASRPPALLRKLLLGTVVMLVLASVAVALQWLNDVFLRSGAHVLAQTRAPGWLVEAVAFGFHFHLFIFTALAPVLLWVLMNRAFVQALWSQAINVQPQALGKATEQGTQ